MPAIEISDPLPPAITLPREVLEFAISQDLEEFGEPSLGAPGAGYSTEADQA